MVPALTSTNSANLHIVEIVEPSLPPQTPHTPIRSVECGGDRGGSSGGSESDTFKKNPPALRATPCGGEGQRGGSCQPLLPAGKPPPQGVARSAGGGGLARFRKASATAGSPQPIGDQALKDARYADPVPYLEAHGFKVKHEGRHASVRDAHGSEVYRLTRLQDGRWVWCDPSGQDGGDLIALVRAIEGLGFLDAVARLLGSAHGGSVQHDVKAPPLMRAGPKLPPQSSKAAAEGRAYLKGRGISQETIEHAEKAGMVRYALGAVLFVGYDSAGVAPSVTRRATSPADPVQKRDLKGSDKSYPPILPGSKATVWIVEGGLDALALHDMAKRHRRQPPTVIVSGGANVRSFLEREDVQAILKRAERVTVAGENERNPEAQAKADAGHRKQAQRVAEITGQQALLWTPRPANGKDLAEMNYFKNHKGSKK